MKFMTTINKLQAVLTKLRREVQLGEAPKKGDAELHRQVGKILVDNIGEKAGECLCKSEDFPREDCSLHGWIIIFKEQKAAYDRLHKTPDPLHVRVAKALGYTVYQLTPNDPKDKHWCMQYLDGNNEENRFIPDYPNDLVAAMGTLEEYKEKAKTCPIKIQLNTYSDGTRWFVTIPYDCNDERNVMKFSESLPQAICEAIVSHAEGK